MPFFYKKIRFWFRFTVALVKKYYLGIFVGSFSGVVSFFFFPSLLPFIPKIRSTQNIAIVGRFTQGDIPLVIQQKISLGLTTFTPNGQPAPAIATSWDISEDKKSYTINLDTSYVWHDGSALKSSDIDYSFRDVTTEVLSPNKLLIKLKEPFSPLPSALSRPLFKLVTTRHLFFFTSQKLLGLGSYQIGKIVKNGPTIESIFLVPSDSDSDLPNLRYIFYPSQDMAITAFKLGLVDTITDISDITPLQSYSRGRTQKHVHYDRYVGLFFNTASPAFGGSDGKNLRLALDYAVNKNRWPNRALGPISPTSWVYNSELKTYDQDLSKAKQIIAKLENKPSLITISASPANFSIAEAIKSDWEQIGIASEIVSTTQYTADYSTLLLTQIIPTDPDQYQLWHSTQSTNITRLNNPRIDILLEKGRQTSDSADRAKIYQEFQKYLVEELPVIFLFHPESFTISR
jgi:peptide/nickel transport system substrate-binding protein